MRSRSDDLRVQAYPCTYACSVASRLPLDLPFYSPHLRGNSSRSFRCVRCGVQYLDIGRNPKAFFVGPRGNSDSGPGRNGRRTNGIVTQHEQQVITVL